MFCVLYNFLSMCNAFGSVWRSKIFFFRKSCVDFDFISLIHSYVYIHIALCYQGLYLQDPVIIWPCHILYSENYHHLFKT